jgi:hypothetical protein
MNVGDLVFAQQFTPSKTPSEWAQRSVIALREPSDPPTINKVTDGDNVINGTGVPGAKVILTWPDGVTTDSTIVLANGTWRIFKPDSVPKLDYLDQISAIQVEMGKGQSTRVYIIVDRRIISF